MAEPHTFGGSATSKSAIEYSFIIRFLFLGNKFQDTTYLELNKREILTYIVEKRMIFNQLTSTRSGSRVVLVKAILL